MGNSPGVLLLLVLCFGISFADAVHGKVPPSSNGAARIQVVVKNSQGMEQPASAVIVSVTEYVVVPPMRGGTGRPEKVKTHVVRTDETGMVEVQLSSGQGNPRISASVVHEGATFGTGMVDPRKGTTKVNLYPLAPVQTDLVAVMWCRVRVQEIVSLIECVVRLSVRGNRAVRLSADGPRIPFLALEVAENYFLDHTITDKAFDHFKADVEGHAARVIPHPKGIVLEGVVLPGTPVSVRVRYHIPHRTEETLLGFATAFDLSLVSLHVESTKAYPTALTVSQPGERATSTQDGHIIQQYRSHGPLRAGGIIKVRLGNLPRYNPWWKRFMTLAMIMILAVVVLIWFRFRSEEGEGD